MTTHQTLVRSLEAGLRGETSPAREIRGPAAGAFQSDELIRVAHLDEEKMRLRGRTTGTRLSMVLCDICLIVT